MRYSRRLTSLTNHLIFVFVGLAGTAELFVNRLSHPWIMFGVFPILVVYLLGGTLGWTWTQRTGRYQRIYYPVMVILGSAIIIIATWVVQIGVAAAIVILPLALHGAVLSRTARILFLATIMAGIVVSAFLVQPLTNGLLGLISVLSGVIAFDFVGRIIVSEEEVHEQLARYAREIEELSIMRERNRLAREIHDNLGHYLIAINMQAQAAHAVLKIAPEQAMEALNHIQTLAHEGLQEVRKSIAAVRSLPMENRSLHEAIEALVSDAQSRGLLIDFQIIGEPVPNSAEVEITIYRIVQEALTNIHKHARAQHATIKMHYGIAPASIKMEICDDGVGAEKAGGGYGLLGLRERVRLLGGTLQIRTAPGEGFCIEVEVGK